MQLLTNRTPVKISLSIVVALLWSASAQGGMITFEAVPGYGSPIDGLAISTQYAATTGMSFSLQGGGSPVLAQMGGAQTAFTGVGSQPDQPAPGEPVGSWFLTDDGVVGAPPLPLLITYSSVVGMAGGAIIDVDGTEAFTIEAFNASIVLLDSLTLNSSSLHAGDGLATDWWFVRPSADIAMVRITFIGPYDHGIGMAFDNFWTDAVTPSFTAAPEPSSLVLLGTGLLALAFPLWKKRHNVECRSSNDETNPNDETRK